MLSEAPIEAWRKEYQVPSQYLPIRVQGSGSCRCHVSASRPLELQQVYSLADPQFNPLYHLYPYALPGLVFTVMEQSGSRRRAVWLRALRRARRACALIGRPRTGTRGRRSRARTWPPARASDAVRVDRVANLKAASAAWQRTPLRPATAAALPSECAHSSPSRKS